MYGIAIPALALEDVPDFSSFAEYYVTPSKSLELYTWKEAIGQEEIAPILERLMTSALLPSPSSQLVALGQSQFQSGLVVYVQPTLDEKGIPEVETLELTTTIPFGASSDMVIVIAKEGSRFHLTNILSGGEDSSVFARTMLVLTEGDTKVDIYAHTKDARGFATIENIALVAPHASCDIVEDPEATMRYRSHARVLLLGEEARSEVLHTLIARENSSYDIWAGVEHRGSHTHSRVYALGLADDASKIVYRGVIDMKKGIAKVDGAQEGKFLILSPKAEVDAIPALDIGSKEVHSSHKLSISHIRDIDLFYAKTRGIPDSEARALAIEGFFGSLLEHLKKESLLTSIRERIANLTKT